MTGENRKRAKCDNRLLRTEAGGGAQPRSRTSMPLTEPIIQLAGQNWSRTVDDALVTVRSFQGVCLASRLIAVADRAVCAHAVALNRETQVVALRAASDCRDRGAKAAVLATRNGIALLGDAPWLDADAREALRRVLEERLAVSVDVMGRSEITVRVPTPGGAWWRLPARVRSRRALAIEVTPVPEGEEILDLINGAPAFTEYDQLAGFVRVVRLPPPYQPGVMIERPATGAGQRPTPGLGTPVAMGAGLMCVAGGDSREQSVAWDPTGLASVGGEAERQRAEWRSQLTDSVTGEFLWIR